MIIPIETWNKKCLEEITELFVGNEVCSCHKNRGKLKIFFNLWIDSPNQFPSRGSGLSSPLNLGSWSGTAKTCSLVKKTLSFISSRRFLPRQIHILCKYHIDWETNISYSSELTQECQRFTRDSRPKFNSFLYRIGVKFFTS